MWPDLSLRPASTRVLLIGFLAGLLLQVQALPFRGTGDVTTFKRWAVSAYDHGLFQAYGSQEQTRRFVMPDYPPLSVVLLAATAIGHEAVVGAPRVRDGTMTVAVKALALLARLGALVLVFLIARAWLKDVRTAMTVAIVMWLNPALWLNGPVLGYLDPVCWLAGLASLACLPTNRSAAVVLAVCAAMIKPQGVFFLLPVAAVTGTQLATAMKTAFAGGITATAILAPFILGSGIDAFKRAMAVNTFEDTLSAQAFNAWWIVTAALHVANHGAQALSVQLDWIQESAFAGIAGFHPRLWMAAVVIAVAVRIGWAVRGLRTLRVQAAYLAFILHVYFIVAISVHENHQVYAVVVLGLLAWLEPSYRKLYLAISVITCLNMLLFYMPGVNVQILRQTAWFLPVTVALSAVNMLLLVPHARLLAGVLRRQATVTTEPELVAVT